MYQYLGDVRLYNILGGVGFWLLLIFNVCHFRRKTEFLSGPSKFILKETGKTSSRLAMSIAAVIELVIISFIQNYFAGSINIPFGELVGTGGNFFGTLFFIPVIIAVFCLVFRIDMYKQFDLITPAFCVTLFFAKLACFCAGCCNGIEWSSGFYNVSTGLVEFPVQLVEAGLALIILVFLLIYRKKGKEGTLYPIFIIIYSGTRFFSEFLRAEENVFWILKTYHILCLCGIIGGIIGLVIVHFDLLGKCFYPAKDFISEKIDDLLIVKGVRKPKRKGNKTTRYKGKKRKKNINVNNVTNQADVKKNKKDRASNVRMWILVWLLGLIGQIGWNVEGVWLNTFVYEKIDKNPSIITPMLILSALATTVVIFIFGTVSDRTGKRRNLISTGFVLWGFFTIAMGFTQFLAKSYLMAAIVSIIICDMLLSFFASMSTDVGYSTWLTDIMNEKNRGQIGGAIAVQCVLGSMIGNIVGGALVGSENNYLRLFIVTGSFLSVVGLVSVFLFNKKDDVRPSVTGSFSQQLFRVFDLRTLLKNKELLLVNLAVAIFFIGYNTYFPHLGNYIIHYLGFEPDKLGIIEAIPLLLAMIVTVPASRFINNGKFLHVSLFAVVSGVIGALFIFPILPESVDTTGMFDIRLFAAILLVGSSYIVMLQSVKVWTKNLYPKEHKGQYEGIFAISFALIPMIFGSNIGEMIVKGTGNNVFNELTGRYEYIPNGNIFLIGTIISVISIIPAILAIKCQKADKKIEE